MVLNMKTYLTFLLLIAAIGSNAQILVKIKSKSALADSIYINRGASELVLFVVNATGDTARSMDYSFSATSDTLLTTKVEVKLYDKRAGCINTASIIMPDGQFNKWTVLNNRLLLYIQSALKRVSKQN